MSTLKIFSWAAVITWMAFIFLLSHQPAEESRELSQQVTEVVVDKFEKITPVKYVYFRELHHFLRKSAHFFAYFVLGILVINAIRRCGNRENNNLGIALCICILYAISDEIHQLFVSGRSSEFRDIIIDSLGASAGTSLYQIACRQANRLVVIKRK
jgi:VanZ family protein